MITSEPYINKLEQGIKLLEKQSIDIPIFLGLKKKTSTRKLRFNKYSWKNLVIELAIVLITLSIKKKDIEDQQKVVISIIIISTKSRELQSYNKVMNNTIHGQYWY